MKSKTYDITPSYWATATSYQKQQALFFVLRVLSAAEEIRMTKKKLLLTLEGGMSGAADAIQRAVESCVPKSERETKVLEALKELSCGDNSCLVWPRGEPKGVGTNGGCRCFRDVPQEFRIKIHQVILLMNDRLEIETTRPTTLLGETT